MHHVNRFYIGGGGFERDTNGYRTCPHGRTTVSAPFFLRSLAFLGTKKSRVFSCPRSTTVGRTFHAFSLNSSSSLELSVSAPGAMHRSRLMMREWAAAQRRRNHERCWIVGWANGGIILSSSRIIRAVSPSIFGLSKTYLSLSSPPPAHRHNHRREIGCGRSH